MKNKTKLVKLEKQANGKKPRTYCGVDEKTCKLFWKANSGDAKAKAKIMADGLFDIWAAWNLEERTQIDAMMFAFRVTGELPNNTNEDHTKEQYIALASQYQTERLESMKNSLMGILFQ